jgi:glycosyltransferase involved in cell wall biosynthesis
MTLSRESTVSVVVVSSDNLDLTSKSVESVLTHTDKGVEVILVDNGSGSGVLASLIDKLRDTRVSILSVGASRSLVREATLAQNRRLVRFWFFSTTTSCLQKTG